MAFKRHLGQLIPLSTYIVLVYAFYSAVLLEKHAPKDLYTLGSTVIHLNPNQQTTLGRVDLLQRTAAGAADDTHVKFMRDSLGNWSLQNLSTQKKIDIKTNLVDSHMINRWRLNSGDTIDIGRQSLKVIKVNPKKRLLVLEHLHSKTQWRWEKGQTFQTNISGQRPRCNDLRLPWFLMELRRYSEIKLFSIGGLNACTDRFPLPGVLLHSAWIYWFDNSFWLGPGNNETPVYFSHQQTLRLSFNDIIMPFIGDAGKIEQLVLGKTRYQVRLKRDALWLTPLGNKDYWHPQELDGQNCTMTSLNNTLQCNTNNTHTTRFLEKAHWLGHGLSLKQWLTDHTIFSILSVFSLLALVALFTYWHRKLQQDWRHSLYEFALIIPAAVFGFMLLGTAFLTPSADLSVQLLFLFITWSWASLILHWSGRLYGLAGVLWFCATFFTALGTFTLMQLGVGSLNSRWITFAQKHLILLTAFSCLVLIATAIPQMSWRHWLQRVVSDRGISAWWLRVSLPLLLTAVLVLQGLIGTEKGIFGVQPIEMAKLVIVFIAGMVGTRLLELRRVGADAYLEKPLLFILNTIIAALLFTLFAVAIMIAVRDFSPFLIVFTFIAAVVWRLAQHPEGRSRFMAGLLRTFIMIPILVFISVSAWIYTTLPTDISWIPQYERFLVWAKPQAHPHTGAQLLAALDFVHLGGWQGGQESAFGQNSRETTIPAIHNDFIGAFLLYRFGGTTAMLLLAVQFLFLISLLTLSKKYIHHSEGLDYKERESHQAFSLILYGLAWIFGLHWFISWCNVLGLLPIMGQPMTWISAANSHLLFFALPGLYLSLIFAWIYRESDVQNNT